MCDETVQVGEARGSDVEALLADVINSLVVDHEGAVGVLQGGVSRQNGIVWLNDGVGHRRGRVNAELELRLLAIVGGKTLENEGTETRTSSTTERVENKEALETIAVVGQPADLVHDKVNLFLADGVVTTSV